MEGEIGRIIEKLLEFRDERDWKRFHTPKNLAISLAIEAAELLEHFQWRDDREVEEFLSREGRASIKEELADVMIYLLLLCEATGIDILKAVEEKIEINRKKYPVHKARGTAKKYTDL